MKAVVRFFQAGSILDLNKSINGYAQKYPNWEIVSVSHTVVLNQISAAIVMRRRDDAPHIADTPEDIESSLPLE